jgi:CubicO group peptidase (beta-lactamase class C family)
MDFTARLTQFAGAGLAAAPKAEKTIFSNHKTRKIIINLLWILQWYENPGGRKAVYCSAMNLLGAIIQNLTRTDLTEFFDQKIARPLQFKAYQLNLSPNGTMYGSGDMYLRARDVLKLGQVYLDPGIWNEKRILDSDWIRQSNDKAHVSH